MLIIFLVAIALFVANFFYERRTIWLGVTFWCMMLCGLIYLWPHIQYPSLGFYLVFFPIILLMIIGPIGFGLLCFYKSFQLLTREGRRWSNFLSLGLGLVALSHSFLYTYVSAYVYIEQNLWLLIPYVVLTLLEFYLLMQLVLFTTASFLNFIPFRKRKLDYIIVLGAGLNGDKVTPLLASRINKGILLYRKNAQSKLILSGGQGPDELVSEAEAMRNYALAQGVPEGDILLENQSRNTRENLRFSYQLMAKSDGKVAIVTNYYHVFRALILAKQEGLSCVGYGAKTKFYFSLNAFVREFVGYLVQTMKWQIICFGLFCASYYGFLAFLSYLQNI